MDGPAFCRLAHGILIRDGHRTPTGRLYVDEMISISMTQSPTPDERLQILEIIENPAGRRGRRS